MGIVGAITGQNSMQTQAASQQQSLQALEMQARQMLESGNIPPLNLGGVRADQLQGVLSGLVSQAQSAGAGTAVATLSQYRVRELMNYAQHVGVQLTIPQNVPTAQAPTQAIGGYPQLQQPQQQQTSYNLPSAGYEEYQLGMGIPGYGLDVGGTHFDYGAMTDERMYQLMLASGGSPQTSQTAAPAGYGASPYASQAAGYGASPYGSTAMAGYGASPYANTAMGGYGSTMGQTAGYGASPYASTAMGGYGSAMGQTAGYGQSPYANAAMNGYGASAYGSAAAGAYGSNPYAAGTTAGNPLGDNSFIQAVGGTIGSGMTSDAIRNLGTTISTSGMGASAGGLGGLGFLGGGSTSAIGAGYGTQAGYGASTGMSGLGGLGALGGISGLGGLSGGYGAQAGYGATAGYAAATGMNGLGGLGSLGGISGLGAMGGGTMALGTSYGGTATLTPQQAGLGYGF